MRRWFRGVHLRLAAKALGEFLAERPGYKKVAVSSDMESRDGYALVEFQPPMPKRARRRYKFALHWDDDGRRIQLVDAHLYTMGQVIAERRVPGDMVHPWLTAASDMVDEVAESQAWRTS